MYGIPLCSCVDEFYAGAAIQLVDHQVVWIAGEAAKRLHLDAHERVLGTTATVSAVGESTGINYYSRVDHTQKRLHARRGKQ